MADDKRKDDKGSGVSRRNFMILGGAAVAGRSLSLTAGEALAAGGIEKPSKKARIRSYRPLGRTGFKASDISMGCGSISEPNLVRYAFDQGINFFDTAEGYGNGDSEKKIGEAMKHLDRDKIFIVTKLPIKKEETEKSILDRFAKCQERMQTKYVDALYMHSVTDVGLVKHKAFHSAVTKLKKEGRLRHAGISSHGPRGVEGDSMEKVLLAATEDGRFDLMLLVYNFLNFEQGNKIIAACKEKDIGITIMKAAPGEIAIEPFDPEKPNEEYAKVLDRLIKQRGMKRAEAIERIRDWIKRREPNIEKSKPFIKKWGVKTKDELASKSFQWVLGNPDIHTVCISMRDFDLIDKFLPLSGTMLSSAGKRFLEDYRWALGDRYCRHGCNQCVAVCPYGLPVSTIMRYAGYFSAQGREKLAMQKYARLEPDGSRCIDCDAPCAGACPHGLPIQASMTTAHSLLSLA